MAKITIEDVRQKAEENSWKVLSLKYKNLNEELEFECPEGHTVFSSFKKFRVKQVCPLCAKNTFKDMDTTIEKKKKDAVRVLALDQATYNTGWAVYDNERLVKYGVFETVKSETLERIFEVKEWLSSMIYNWEPDLIGIEDIQLQTHGAKDVRSSDNVIGIQTFKTLAQLQGALATAVLEENLDLRVCPPGVWRKYCGVKGRSKVDRKRSMQILVKKWFDISVDDDSADAIGLGKYLTQEVLKKDEILLGDWIE